MRIKSILKERQAQSKTETAICKNWRCKRTFERACEAMMNNCMARLSTCRCQKCGADAYLGVTTNSIRRCLSCAGAQRLRISSDRLGDVYGVFSKDRFAMKVSVSGTQYSSEFAAQQRAEYEEPVPLYSMGRR